MTRLPSPRDALANRMSIPRHAWPSQLSLKRSDSDDLAEIRWGLVQLRIPDAPQKGRPWNPAPVMKALVDGHQNDVSPRVAELAWRIVEGAKDDIDFASRWRLAARLCEAASLKLRRRLEAGDSEAAAALPLRDRARVILLTCPFRAPVEQAAQSAPDTRSRSLLAGFARSAFGTVAELVRLAREARSTWARALLAYQDYTELANLDIETEARLLVWENACHAGARVLSIRTSAIIDGRSDPLPPQDEPSVAFAVWFGREFFSRRFMLRDLLHIPSLSTRWDRALKHTVVGLGVVVLCAVASAAVLTAWPDHLPTWRDIAWPHWAALGAGAAAYLIIITGTVASESFAYPFALRFGAGVVIGSALALALPPEWAHSLSRLDRILTVSLGLTLASYGYLVVEARLHGLAGWRTVLARSLAVLFTGLAHAAFLATVAVCVLAPVFIENWDTLDLGTREFSVAILLIGSLAVAAGVFLQILWDDRPVTYPLSAMRFSRRQP
jgi:hypothetical protein